MLWNKNVKYLEEPFESESELEKAIIEVSQQLFGVNRVYIDVKRKIGLKGSIRNIPDGYLLDLSSLKTPVVYVVEVELAGHDPLKHIAVQVLEFSLSFETSPTIVKSIIKNTLLANPEAMARCQQYATTNNYDNVDVLLEKMVYGNDTFRALVVIDEVTDELETVLISRFKFPVEIITLNRHKSSTGERLYHFEPFLEELGPQGGSNGPSQSPLDPSDIDTIVVPAQEEGFINTFVGENCWYQIRIHSSMIPKLKYIAAYQVAPESAITHFAEIQKIELYKDTNKYIVYFKEPANTIGPIRLVKNGQAHAPQAPRYTSFSRLSVAKDLDQAF